MFSGRVLPPASGPEPGKKKQTQLVAAAVILGIAVLSIALLLLLASISSFSLPWVKGNSNQSVDAGAGKVLKPAAEEDYVGVWQMVTPDRKSHTLKLTADNRFTHWIADNVSMQAYGGSWRYDSSLSSYRLVYDREDYSASVKISPAAEGELLIMHFEPLSSGQGMPLKGFDLGKVEIAPAAPEY